MHQLIRVLVPGTTQDDALARAHGALDALVGVGFDTVAVFDYYKTFEEVDARFKPYVANVISDDDSESVDAESVAPAFPIDGEDGQALLEDALDNQVEEFREAFGKFQAKLDYLTVEDVMNDVEGARFNLQQLAEYEGASVYLYNEFGSGLSSPKAVTACVDRLQNVPFAGDGGGVDAEAATEGGKQASRVWLVPADVHY